MMDVQAAGEAVDADREPEMVHVEWERLERVHSAASRGKVEGVEPDVAAHAARARAQ
jgi:hypothetical protein